MTTNTIRRSALGAGQFVLKIVTLALRAAGLVLLVVFKAAAAVCALDRLFDENEKNDLAELEALCSYGPKDGYWANGTPIVENTTDSGWGAIYGKDFPKHDRVIDW